MRRGEGRGMGKGYKVTMCKLTARVSSTKREVDRKGGGGHSNIVTKD